jgi:hypothetical protein
VYIAGLMFIQSEAKVFPYGIRYKGLSEESRIAVGGSSKKHERAD